MARARPAARSSSRSSTATTAIRFIVLTGAGGAFTAGGDIPGFLEVDAGERLAARRQRRRAGALLEAGDRGAAGLRLRRRVRAGARLRLPHRRRRRAARASRGNDRHDSRLRRHAAPGAPGRPRAARRTSIMRGATRRRPRNARARARHRDRPPDELDAAVAGCATSCAGSLRSRWRWASACSITSTTARSSSASRSRGWPTGCCARRTTFARASRPSPRSGRPSSRASEVVDRGGGRSTPRRARARGRRPA